MQKQILFGEVGEVPLSLREVPLLKEVELLFSKHLLRLCLLLIICQASITNAKAQWVSIPDTNFGTWLNMYGYNTCLQGNNAVGWQMDTTCNAVTSATNISCTSANIQDLNGIQYFTQLQILNCYSNLLTVLPSLPISLTYLDCGLNSLTTLPSLPDSLTHVNCKYNQLSTLPSLPSSLTYLYCFNNQLTALPSLPGSLTELHCYNNQLTVLPALPSSLTLLYCFDNPLSALPSLPGSLIILYCWNNQLSALPELPDSLAYLLCYNNPNLTCLPQLKKINNFDFSNTSITCLPNYPQSNSTSNPLLSSVPLCDIFNPNNCAVYYNISGKVYEDSILDCVYDAAETPLLNASLNLYQNGSLISQTNSYNAGAYSFETDTGTYTYSIDTTNLPFVVFCPDSGYYTSVITALDSFDTDMNFGLRCKPGFDVGAQSINGRFRPGNTRQLNISAGELASFYGAHCATGTSGSVQLIINGAAHYTSAVSGAITPTNVSNDTITWDVADFGAVNFFSDFNINVATDTTAVLGSQICFTLIVNPIAGDNNPANNILTHCFTVVGSFDPNEKEVYPAGNIDTAQKWLTYTIHFQNTGTAEAQHIYVTDTLDSDVDASSFQLLAYSHQPMVQIKENAVRFNFPNINLPDSNTNEPLSHGYVQYKVKLKDNLPVGTNISNTAFIYFDFNAPVVTNTTTNTIALATGVSDVRDAIFDVRLFPNPAGDFVNITVDQAMAKSKLTITDITGRKITVAQIENRVSHIETSAYPNGIYFVTVENERGRVTRKLIIQK